MRKRKACKFYIILAMAGIILGTQTSKADAKAGYPVKPITIVVPFGAGGSTDIAVRGIVPYLMKYLNTSVIIQNKPGAGGLIGYTTAFQAAPDGYTLLAWNTLPPCLEEQRREVKFKTLAFTPVFAFARNSSILVTYPERSKTFEEFLKTARTQTINIGTTGVYTQSGLMGLLLAEEADMKVNWVPFGGGGESLTALAGKHIDAVVTVDASALPLTRAGKIRPLVIFNEKRHPKFPDVPVSGELGLNVPLLFNLTGVVGPPGMAAEKVKTLAQAFAKAVKDPEYLEWLKKVGSAELLPYPPKEYRQELERVFAVAEKYKVFLKEK